MPRRAASLRHGRSFRADSTRSRRARRSFLSRDGRRIDRAARYPWIANAPGEAEDAEIERNVRLLLAHYDQTSADAVIAQAIAFGIEETMGARGSVDIESMNASARVGAYDGFVIGTNLAAGRWPQVTQRFLANNAAAIAGKPTAIYVALTGPVDRETQLLVEDAVATDRTKQFVAVRMPLQIAPHRLRGIGLFVAPAGASTNGFVLAMKALYSRLFQASSEDDEYARAGRVFGGRVGARFKKDR